MCFLTNSSYYFYIYLSENRKIRIQVLKLVILFYFLFIINGRLPTLHQDGCSTVLRIYVNIVKLNKVYFKLNKAYKSFYRHQCTIVVTFCRYRSNSFNINFNFFNYIFRIILNMSLCFKILFFG